MKKSSLILICLLTLTTTFSLLSTESLASSDTSNMGARDEFPGRRQGGGTF
jgi:hypothetical protein